MKSSFKPAFLKEPSSTRRGDNEIVNIYLEQKRQSLSTHENVEKHVYISKFEGLTLEEYIRARSLVCIRNHKKPCKMSVMD